MKFRDILAALTIITLAGILTGLALYTLFTLIKYFALAILIFFSLTFSVRLF